MNLALTVLEIVAPVFLLASVGFIWVKCGIEYRMQFVTRLAMTFSLPCLVFVALMETKIEGSALAALTMASVAAYGVVSVAFLLITSVTGLDRRTFAGPLIFGNTGNLGLPLALFAFGDTGLAYAVVVFAITTIWFFTFGVWLVAGEGSLGKVLREPIVAATLLGGLFLWQGWQTPVFLTNTLKLAGQLMIPLMLITLGVAVAGLKPGSMLRAMALSLLKLAICVPIALAAGLFFDLDRIAFGVLVLQIATPVAVISYMLAEKYGAASDEVAGLVVASTLLSVIALPSLLAFLL